MPTIALTTLATARQHLQKAASDTAHDTLISALILRASAAVEAYAQRELGDHGTATRRFAVTGPLVNLAPGEARSVTTVTLHPEATSPVTLTSGVGYALEPVGATSLGTYTTLRIADGVDLVSTHATRFGYAQIDIAASWGPAAVQEDVELACLVAVGAWYRRYSAGVGVGAVVDEPLDVPESLPAASRSLVAPYRRLTVA